MPVLAQADNNSRSEPIPVVLFAYARPAHLARVLACLRENQVPLILAYADGAKGETDAARVVEVRALLRAVDWCEVRLVERKKNLGLGANVLAGVTEVAAEHEAFIVWEDDLVCVPGTYAWMCAALRQYAGDGRVMSVSAWTHPRVTPDGVGDRPYFDGRADCWVWGAWARSWRGMEETALQKMERAASQGMPSDAYGTDLPEMARMELNKNIWAVRWLYHHLVNGGLAVRPAWSMVEHIGLDNQATNAADAEGWANPAMNPCPPIPCDWPEPEEHDACRSLWRAASLGGGVAAVLRGKGVAGVKRAAQWAKALVPAAWKVRLRAAFGWRWFRGDYCAWSEALARSGGYADPAILERIITATMAVRIGVAEYERDGVLFHEPNDDEALLQALLRVRPGGFGKVRVLDFGGSLGAVYWRHRHRLHDEGGVSWDVVEQPQFVEAGRRHFAGEELRFYFDVNEAQAGGAHDVLLCSGVLQYLEDPWRALAEWSRLPVPFLLLVNLPLHADGPTRLRVQHVPPSIYPASYPVRFFNRDEFMRAISPNYEVVKEFASEAVWPVDRRLYPSTGLLLKHRDYP